MSYFGIPVRNGLPIGLGSVAPLASSTSSPFSPASFFANGEQGWWFDPSNSATLFQDSAGTTPVTAVEQPVGLMLDLSKGLVLGSELVTNGDFSNGSTGWSVAGGTIDTSSGSCVISSGAVLSQNPAAQSNKWQIVEFDLLAVGTNIVFYAGGSPYATYTTTGHKKLYCYPSGTQISFVTSGQATIDNISVKELAGNHRFQSTSANRPTLSARVNLLTKTEQFNDAVWTKTTGVTATGATVAYNGLDVAGWKVYQAVTTSNTARTLTCVVSGTGSIDLYSNFGDKLSVVATSTPTTYQLPLTLLGTNSGNVGIWSTTNTAFSVSLKFDLRPANQGVGLPAYQRVNTSTDYDSTGFPVYIKPNGSNQFMVTNSINFTATDKMTVWYGARSLTAAGGARGMFIELSTLVSNAGAFALDVTPDFYRIFGVSNSGAAVSPIPAPFTTKAVTGQWDGSLVSLRENGTLSVVQPQVSASFGNYPAYFYARGGTSLFFNGNDYGSIARGAASTAAQITAGETYINSKTKAY